MYVDAAFSNDDRRYVVGYAVIDCTKRVLMAGCTFVLPTGMSLAAEVEAILIGLQACIRHGFNRVSVLSDSQVAVSAIQRGDTYLGPKAMALDQIRHWICMS